MTLYERFAELRMHIDTYALEPLSQPLSDGRVRRTTVIRLRGGEEEGIGEDATPTEPEQLAFQAAPQTLPLAGDWTLESFSAQLDTLDLFPAPPPFPQLRSFRRWAFESAALDLALRQAGRSLADAVGRIPQPVTFVNSLRLPEPDTIEPIRRRLQANPGLRFKLDPTLHWNAQLIERIAATGAVATLDLKGQYPPQAPIAQPANSLLYARLADAFPNAWIEDPALTPATDELLRPHRDRITWDAPIRTVADMEAMPYPPRAVNIKPARIGALHALLDVYDHCERGGIGMYGGGMFELGPGRDQIQYLASLFHPDAPNDTAPTAYNREELPGDAPTSPIAVAPGSTGFRFAQPAISRAAGTPPSSARKQHNTEPVSERGPLRTGWDADRGVGRPHMPSAVMRIAP
jgi:L-alanine-DL-glutamate epimerase-like enolase superfamily enzyme